MKFKVFDYVIIKKNRNTFYGSCIDLIELEGQQVQIVDIRIDYKNRIVFTIKDTNGRKHFCEECNLEPVSKSKVQSIKFIQNDKTCIVILEDGRKGIAKCNSNDEFNEYTGFCIAFGRALYGQDATFAVTDEEIFKTCSNATLLSEVKRRMEK